MKKTFFAFVAVALMLGMVSCQKEQIDTNSNRETPGTNDNVRVKSAADLIGTEWEYTLNLAADMDSADLDSLYDCMDSSDVADMLTMTFGLTFDTAYAHLTFPEDVIGLNVIEDGDDYTVEEISQMNYSYTYDPTTMTGTLTGGNLDTLVLDFTYNATADAIIFNLMVSEDGDENNATPMQLIFHRI